MLRIVVDENISYAEEAFSMFGDLILEHGRKINNTLLADTDILIVRSITEVNRDLLETSNVKFVGTATIGMDHIDLDYLKKQNIEFASAKGCNADAVAEYVFSAIFNIAAKKKISLNGKSIGVIGFGNIGSRIVKLSGALGLKTLINDPPLQRAGIKENFVDLETTLTADIITFHVPLNIYGIDKTYHLLDENKLKLLRKNVLLINSSRGPVIDNNVLLDFISEKDNTSIVLDVWENEPDIKIELLKKVTIGTAHIAGYSLEGKVNGTKMMHDAVCKFLDCEPGWKPELPAIENNEINVNSQQAIEEIFNKVISEIYYIEEDDFQLRNLIDLSSERKINHFDDLRKFYRFRREFCNYKIKLNPFDNDLAGILRKFRFSIV